MNTIHVEVTPGVSYTLHCKVGSTPLTAQLYDTTGVPSRSYTIAPGRSAYMTCEYGVLTLESDGECAWRLVPLSLSETGGGDAQTLKGDPGAPGKSAYELAMGKGYTGTLEEWLASLKGEKGDKGKSAYQVATEGGFVGTLEEWLATLKGDPGENTGLTHEEVEAMLTTGTEEVVRSTPEGTSNATFRSFELGPGFVPTGALKNITLRCGGSIDNITSEAFFLGVWEKSADGSDWELVSVSNNAAAFAANTTIRWDFDAGELHGRLLFIGGLFAPAVGAPKSDVTFRGRTTNSEDGATRVFTDERSYNFTPQMSISTTRLVPRFASSSDLTEHTNNTASHVSPSQASILSAFEWDAVRGVSFIHTTDGTVDNRLRVLLSATGTNLVTSGTLTIQAAQVAMSTRTIGETWTDPTSGTSYNYGGHTMSTTEMAPYGITEACVWSGEPSLPLLLRGSEIRINGNVIDVDKLIELLNKADSILAHVGEETPAS